MPNLRCTGLKLTGWGTGATLLHYRGQSCVCCLQAEVYEVTRGLTYPVPLLDLRVYCLYGYGMDTDEGYLYNVDHFNASAPPAPTRTQQGDGDGTVNLASLQACSK